MNTTKTDIIPNARKLITTALLEFYKLRGVRARYDFFKPGLDSLKLSKTQLEDRQSNGVYVKYRALTGTIINELINANKIAVKDHSFNDGEKPEQIVPVKLPTKKALPVQTLTQRRRLIVQTITSKYLTSDEQKHGPKINKLKSFVNDKRQTKNIELGTLEDAIAYVDKWFIKNQEINLSSTKVNKKQYPNTDIGQCLDKQYQLYLRYVNHNISKKEYEKELQNALICAIQILGGAFFEKLSLDIIKKVYGNRVVANSDKLNGGPHDHGIDAELKVADEFGMQDLVHIQSKLSEKGEKAIREFVGAMTLENGNKGIFMSAGSISYQTRKYFENRNRARKLTIIGREELIALMKEHSVGVKTQQQEFIIDDDYFLSE